MTRGLMSGLSLASLIALLLIPLSAWVLWRTSFGLRLRSSGEAPEAAESLGVNVIRVRYIGLLISGGFAGLGGGFLSIISSSYYRQGQTAGRGFIGLATMIFGNWRPSGILGGAAVFGYSEGIKLVAGGSITGLFLFIFFGIAAFTTGSGFSAVINSVLPLTGGGALGAKEEGGNKTSLGASVQQKINDCLGVMSKTT